VQEAKYVKEIELKKRVAVNGHPLYGSFNHIYDSFLFLPKGWPLTATLLEGKKLSICLMEGSIQRVAVNGHPFGRKENESCMFLKEAYKGWPLTATLFFISNSFTYLASSTSQHSTSKKNCLLEGLPLTATSFPFQFLFHMWLLAHINTQLYKKN
jgi:hypothetical protein